VKVLHILHSIERSGLELMLASAAGAFAAAGVETHVLSTGASEGRLADQFRALGFTIHHAPFRVSAGFFRGLYLLMRRERFDVVHIHTEQAFFWYGLTARVAGVPRVVYHVHGYFDFRGTLRLERILQRRLGRVALGMTCITVGPSAAANERKRFLNPSTIVGNWVDADAFHPVPAEERRALRARLGLPASAPLIVSVGACAPLKNHGLIVESLPLMRKLVADGEYVHIGSGGEEAAEHALAERLGVGAQCRFLGERDDVADLLAACDVLVMPSEHEGFGMAALEALSCGLPVVATDVPGLRDAVANGQTGALVDVNAESLAAAAACFLEDPELRERLGAEGRRRVMERHSPAAGVAGWLAVYRG
jgi:glycosyltransferase involved in cell wall biosynthesis